MTSPMCVQSSLKDLTFVEAPHVVSKQHFCLLSGTGHYTSGAFALQLRKATRFHVRPYGAESILPDEFS
jgi:hypothetical protein